MLRSGPATPLIQSILPFLVTLPRLFHFLWTHLNSDIDLKRWIELGPFRSLGEVFLVNQKVL